MFSRRAFVRLLSWGAGGLFVGIPSSATGGDSSVNEPSSSSNSDFDYRVSTVDNESTAPLAEWTGRSDHRTVALRWRPQFERRIRRFVVQQQRVPVEGEPGPWRRHGAMKGAGTTNEGQPYRYEAEDLSSGLYRFRLKMVGPEGVQAGYSEAIDLRVGRAALFEWGGRAAGRTVKLRWRTQFERGVQRFVVQRRRVGGAGESGSWRQAGTVAAVGKTTEGQSYRHEVEGLLPGEHHFRLKKVGPKETPPTYSEPVSVSVGMDQPVQVIPPAPNPVHDRFSFSFAVREERAVTAVLYDTLGRRVRTVYDGTPPPRETQSVWVDAASMAAGSYFLRFRAGDHVETHRVMVVR